MTLSYDHIDSIRIKLVDDITGAISYIKQPFKVEDLGHLVLSTLEKEYEGGIRWPLF